MKIAVISDIHANAVALTAVLDAIRSESIDRIICLGDVVSDGPQPVETLSLIRRNECLVIMGNADAQVLGIEPGLEGADAEVFNDAACWSASLFGPDEKAFLESFAPRLMLEVEGKALSFFHGSPKSFNDEIYPTTPDDALRAFLSDHPAALHVGGHTHMQMIRRIDQSVFVNAGSVGMAYDRTRGAPGTIKLGAWAEFAVLTVSASALDISLRRVAFDAEAMIDAIKASGMPHSDWWLAAWKAAATL